MNAKESNIFPSERKQMMNNAKLNGHVTRRHRKTTDSIASRLPAMIIPLISVYALAALLLGWFDPLALIATGITYAVSATGYVSLTCRASPRATRLKRTLPASQVATVVRTATVGVVLVATTGGLFMVFQTTEKYNQLVDSDRAKFEIELSELEADDQHFDATLLIERRLRRPLSPQWRDELRPRYLDLLQAAIQSCENERETKRLKLKRNQAIREFGVDVQESPIPLPKKEQKKTQPQTPAPVRRTEKPIIEPHPPAAIRSLPNNTKARLIHSYRSGRNLHVRLAVESPHGFIDWLDRKDFTVLADDRPVNLRNVKLDAAPKISVSLLLDISPTASQFRNDARKTAINIIKSTKPNVHFRTASITAENNVENGWGRDERQVIFATAGPQIEPSRGLRYGIVKCAAHLAKRQGWRILIVFTDRSNRITDDLTDAEAIRVCNTAEVKVIPIQLPSNSTKIVDVAAYARKTGGRANINWTQPELVSQKIGKLLAPIAQPNYQLAIPATGKVTVIKIGHGRNATSLRIPHRA